MSITLRIRLMILLPLFMALMATAKAEGIVWQTDADKAWAAAKEEQRPLLIFFTASGCHWCEEMKNKTFAHAEVVSAIGKSYVPLVVKAEDQSDLANILQVNTYPTTIILSPKKDLPPAERILGRWNGFVPQSTFSPKLAAAAKKTQR